MRRKIREGLIYFCIVCVTLVVGITIIEAINYVTISKREYSYVWPPNLEYVFNPDPAIFQGISGESHFTINQFGYRGPQIKNHANEYRILIVGGSTSECLYLDDGETWPQKVMDKLGETKDGRKVVTMNIGKSGHGIRNNILALKYLPEYYEPDAIIVLAGANDALFKLSRKNAWKPFNESEFNNTEKYTFTVSPGYTWKSSYLYKISNAINPSEKEIKPQDEIGNTLAENRQKRQDAENWITQMPNLSESLKDYQKNLERMGELAKEKKSTLLLLTQPTLWKEEMSAEEDASLWMTYDFGEWYYPTETMTSVMEEYNKALLTVCNENKEIRCLDLEKNVPKTLNYMYDDMHFNEQGAEFVAEEIVTFMKENMQEFG